MWWISKRKSFHVGHIALRHRHWLIQGHRCHRRRTAGAGRLRGRLNYASGAEAADALAAKIKAFGSVDVLVKNAGIMKLMPLAQIEDALFDRHIAVNLKGTFNGLRDASRRTRNGGRIVSFSSSVIGLYQPTYAV